MLDPKKVETSQTPQIETLPDEQLSQIKGGTGTATDGIVVEDIINL